MEQVFNRYKIPKDRIFHLEAGDIFTLEEARTAHCKIEIDMDDGEFILLSPKKKNGIRDDMYNLDTKDNRIWRVLMVYSSYREE